MKCRDHDHSYLPQKVLALGLEILKEKGLKITRQREALLKTAIRLGRPFTAEEICESVKKSGAGLAVDLVTVYRCLAKFVEAGVLTTCDFAPLGDHAVRYEVASLDGSHHHHIVCTVCHRVEPVDFCAIKGQEKILRDLGYTGVSHKLEFFGVCPGCAPR